MVLFVSVCQLKCSQGRNELSIPESGCKHKHANIIIKDSTNNPINMLTKNQIQQKFINHRSHHALDFELISSSSALFNSSIRTCTVSDDMAPDNLHLTTSD